MLKGDCVPLTEVDVPYIRLGEPGPDTRGPSTPGREKAEDDVGGRDAVDPIPKDEENWLERDAMASECPGGNSPGVRLCLG